MLKAAVAPEATENFAAVMASTVPL